jgi:hypothetical protein
MNINLHIERLILDGLSVTRSQALLVQEAIEAQLAHLLATNRLSSELMAGGVPPSVRAGGIHVANSSPTHLGQQIGQAVYDGIGNKPK